ncbi:MAG: hypothetical protein AABX30_03335 [Nanoarchaeota archaeon]
MEKFQEYLIEAEKRLKMADHMAYVTFSLVQDKKLLLKILSEASLAVLNMINSILQHDYLYKKIALTKDARTNLKIFAEKCAPRYNITKEEAKNIINIIELNEKHKQSPFEFIRNGKIVILSDSLQTETITIDKMKNFLNISKNTLEKIKQKMSRTIH